MNIIPLHVVVKEYAFDGPTLASMTGLSVGQVYYRLHRHGVSLRDLRKGEYGYGAEVKKSFTVTNPKLRVHITEMKGTRDEYLDIKNGVKRGRKKKQKTA
jgi:hypothetical protein